MIHRGFEVRVELTLHDGRQLWVQTTRAQADEPELARGQIVWVRPDRTTQFDRDGAPKPDAAPEVAA